MSAAFWSAVVLFLISTAADAYTTKRGLADDYKGVRLPLKEGMPAKYLFPLFGIDPEEVWKPGKNDVRFLLWATVPSGLFLGLLIYAAHRGMQDFATYALFVFALLKLWAARNNRRLILKKRAKIDRMFR